MFVVADDCFMVSGERGRRSGQEGAVAAAHANGGC